MSQTIKQIAKTLKVDAQTAYGLVHFMVKTGVAVEDGTTREPGARGRGASLYKITYEALSTLVGVLAPVITDEDAAPAPAEAQAPAPAAETPAPQAAPAVEAAPLAAAG